MSFAGRALVEMSRVVQAPRAHVYAAWRRPERMARWWSAEHAGGSAEPLGDGTFRVGTVRVRPVEEHASDRIVFTWGSVDGATETLVTVTFTDAGGTTRLAIRQTEVPRHELALWRRLDRLAELLRAS